METERKVTFAKRLRALIEQRSINASDLAREIGISHVSVGKYLKGECLPDASILYDITLFFGVPMESFFKESKEDAYVLRETAVKSEAEEKLQMVKTTLSTLLKKI